MKALQYYRINWKENGGAYFNFDYVIKVVRFQQAIISGARRMPGRVISSLIGCKHNPKIIVYMHHCMCKPSSRCGWEAFIAEIMKN